MVHHWRASDGLLPTENPSEWVLWDRARIVGYIQYGKLAKKPAFRGVLKSGELVQVIGYSPSLEQCCTDLWNWYIRFVKSRSAEN